jgi:hypothetical protein
MSVSITPNPNVQGPQGITGPQGIQGVEGTQGLTGIQGVEGPQGTTGTQGLTGIQGLTGAQGTQGLLGPTVSSTFNAQSTAYTLQASDLNKWVTQSGTANITVPSGVFSAGNLIYIQRTGAGAVSIVASGVTFTSNGSASPALRVQYSAATVLCTGSNTFTIVGDIT